MKKSRVFMSELFKKYPEIVHGFSNRNAGEVASKEFTSFLNKEMGLNIKDLQLMNQQHGEEIAIIKKRLEPPPLADALITNVPGMGIVVRVADCVPVLIYDQKNNAIAVVHAGWRSAVAKLHLKTIKKMNDEFGTDPLDCLVAIGPSIGPCCYEVGPEVLEKFPVSSLIGKSNLDVPGTVIKELMDIGVHPTSIDFLNICTSCNIEECYSYRREKGKTGRHWGILMLKK